MKLAGSVKSLDEVPEAFKSGYEQDGEVFRLKEIEIDDPAEIRSKLTKKEKAVEAANQKLSRYSKFQELQDDELEELLELREMKRQGKPLTVDEKAEYERLTKKQKDAHTAEVEQVKSKLTAYESELKLLKLKTPVKDIALAGIDKEGENAVIADVFDLAWSEIAHRFRLDEVEGKPPRIVVLDEDGDETNKTVEEFIFKEYKPKRELFFHASKRGGSNAPNNTRPSGGGVKVAELSASEKLRLGYSQASK